MIFLPENRKTENREKRGKIGVKLGNRKTTRDSVFSLWIESTYQISSENYILNRSYSNLYFYSFGGIEWAIR